METKQMFDGKTVVKSVATRETNDHEPVEMELTLDFTGVDADTMIKHATKSLVILAQTRFRNHGTEWVKAHPKFTIPVATFFTTREKLTDEQKAKRNVDKGIEVMNDEDKRALLERLKAELK